MTYCRCGLCVGFVTISQGFTILLIYYIYNIYIYYNDLSSFTYILVNTSCIILLLYIHQTFKSLHAVNAALFKDSSLKYSADAFRTIDRSLIMLEQGVKDINDDERVNKILSWYIMYIRDQGNIYLDLINEKPQPLCL